MPLTEWLPCDLLREGPFKTLSRLRHPLAQNTTTTPPSQSAVAPQAPSVAPHAAGSRPRRRLSLLRGPSGQAPSSEPVPHHATPTHSPSPPQGLDQVSPSSGDMSPSAFCPPALVALGYATRLCSLLCALPRLPALLCVSPTAQDPCLMPRDGRGSGKAHGVEQAFTRVSVR